ncbi:hypothetical protein [Clostridium tagluense]|uniref:hypothetical protein n=1 Tax=Clostridium tagluense TaxID=360422 RepID=UPI001CF2E5B4|nr:hypothetical protein [Clostridium tagluense]MCB2298869.1 hypothetical protein [Clostridium tagluense]
MVKFVDFIYFSISVVSSGGDLKKVFPSIFLVVTLVGYSWISVRLIKFVEIKLREDLRYLHKFNEPFKF